ncbi:protein NRT1/ PTR FAMILY 5.5-like [Pistacia vera]|uniref:protein NRT1/ PTR FAMILY 5.5-like n=1 Tax=Pistacia vera TaxID=55513 RepID=UPI001262F00A|nr:protein NRT1/ PTR FAMILY 5.5-like [Pistacia vera]
MGSNMLKSLIHSKWIPKSKKKTAIQAGIWGGIVSSILCSSVGWQVERRRATIIPDHGHMSILWLFPHFFLLGLMKGIVATGLDEFAIDQFQNPWKEYVSEINEFVIGLGNFLSMLFIQVIKILFRDTLNKSRLDVYYHRLTIFSFVNMLFYFSVIYIFYGSKRGMIPDAAQFKRLEEGRELISSALQPPPIGGESTESNINRWGLIGAVLWFRRSLRRRQGYAEVNDFI